MYVVDDIKKFYILSLIYSRLQKLLTHSLNATNKNFDYREYQRIYNQESYSSYI